VKRAVIDARVGAFVYDQRLASYAFAAKSYDAVWDSSLEGFRCPPGSGGGQLTNDFGREYGPAVTRRLVAEFDGDDTKILGRRFNRGAGNRIGRTRRRVTPDISPGALARRRSVASDPNADKRDGDGDGLIFDNTPKEQPAPSGAEQIRDLVAASQLPSRSGERNASVDVARQKTPKTPSRVRKATVRDELPAASKPVVEDSPSEAFVDAQDKLSALSEEAQRLVSDPRKQIDMDDLERRAALARSRMDFEDFFRFNTSGYEEYLDEMDKVLADFESMFDSVDLDSFSDEELATLTNSYNKIYDDFNEQYDLNVMAFRKVSDDLVDSWESADARESQAASDRRTKMRQRQRDIEAQALVDEQAERVRKAIEGTSTLDLALRASVLVDSGVEAPTRERQRDALDGGDPLSDAELVVLQANDLAALWAFRSDESKARMVTDLWEYQYDNESITAEEIVEGANHNLDLLLEKWIQFSKDDPVKGISLAGDVAAKEYYDSAVQLWENAIANTTISKLPLTEKEKDSIVETGSFLTERMDAALVELDENPSKSAAHDFAIASDRLSGFIRKLVSTRKNDDDVEFYDNLISKYRKYYFNSLNKNSDSIKSDLKEMQDQISAMQEGDGTGSYISRQKFDILEDRIVELQSEIGLQSLFNSDELNDSDNINLINTQVEDAVSFKLSINEIENAKVPSIRPDATLGSTRPVIQMEQLSLDKKREFIDKPYELIETLDSLDTLDSIVGNFRRFNNTETELLENIQKLNSFAQQRYDGGDFESFQKATNLIKKSESYLSKIGIARVEYLNEQDLEGFDIVEQRKRIDAAIATHLDVHSAYEELVNIEEKAEFIINRVRDARVNVLADNIVERYGQTDAPWLDANYNPQNIEDFYKMYNAARDIANDKAAQDAIWRWAQSVWGHSVEDGSIPIRTRDGSLFKTVLDKSNSNTEIPRLFYGKIFKFNEDVGDWEQVGHFSRLIHDGPQIGNNITKNSFLYMGDDAGFNSPFANEAKNSGFQSVFNPHAFMWLNAAGFSGTELQAAEDGTYVWARLGFRPRSDSYYKTLSRLMKGKVQAYREGLDSVVLNEAQAALLEFLINKSETSRHSHLSAPGLGEYLAVLEFSEINPTMTARERSQQMMDENFGEYGGGIFKYEGNVARDPRDLTTRARWES
jgi:hypothetical protein